MEGYDGELIAEREFEDEDFDMNDSQLNEALEKLTSIF